MGILAIILVAALIGAVVGGLVDIYSKLNPDIDDKSKGFNGPRSEYGAVIPYVFGTVQIDSPLCIYGGDAYAISPYTYLERIDGSYSGPTPSERDNKTPQYSVALDLLLCKRIFKNGAPLGKVTLNKIWYGDSILWSGVSFTSKLNYSASLLDIDPNRYTQFALPGGKTNSSPMSGWWLGGIQGLADKDEQNLGDVLGWIDSKWNGSEHTVGFGMESVRFYEGSGNEPVNQYLLDQLGEYPKYNEFVRLVFEDFFWGSSGGISKITIEMSHSIPAPELGDTVGINTDGQVNPINVLYHILTNSEFFGNSKLPQVDTTSFTAARLVCESENLFMSYLMTGKTKASDLVDNIMSYIDGVLYIEPSTRKVNIKLLRHDYVVSELPVIDETIIDKTGPTFDKTSWEQTYSQSKINFTLQSSAPNGMSAKSVAVAKDNGLSDSSGIVESSEESNDLVRIGRTANYLATRKLTTLNTPVMKVSVPILKMKKGSFDPSGLRPGDLFVLKYTPLEIEQIVIRVSEVSLGTLDDNIVTIKGVQDRFKPEIILADPIPTDVGLPVINDIPMDRYQIITAPLIIAKIGQTGNGLKNTVNLTDVPEDSITTSIDLGHNYDRFLTLIKKPDLSPNTWYANVKIKDNDTGLFLESFSAKYTPCGVLGGSIPDPWDDTGTGHYGGFTITDLSASDISHLAPSDTDGVIDLRNIILINGEFMAIKEWSFTGSTLTVGLVERVLLDSDWFNCNHSVGTSVWFLNLLDTEGMKSRMSQYYKSNVVRAIPYDDVLSTTKDYYDGFGTFKYFFEFMNSDPLSNNIKSSTLCKLEDRSNLPLPPRRLYITSGPTIEGGQDLTPGLGRIGAYNRGLSYAVVSLVQTASEAQTQGYHNPRDDEIRKHGQTWPNGRPYAYRERLENFLQTSVKDSTHILDANKLLRNYVFDLNWKKNSGSWNCEQHFYGYATLGTGTNPSPYTLWLAVKNCYTFTNGTTIWKLNVGRPSVYKFNMNVNADP